MEDVRRVAYALRSMEFAVFQDQWPPDFFPACTDFTSVWENDETEPKLSHPPLFSQIVTLPQISTYCLLSVFPETSLEPTALNTYPDFRCFFEGSGPITHARRARCPAHVGSIFNECSLCHCHELSKDAGLLNPHAALHASPAYQWSASSFM